MNLALTAVITMLFAEQQFDFGEMLNSIIKWMLRGVMFLLNCFLSPVTLFRALKSRERCPPVRNKLLLVSATELARRIRAQEVTSEEVVMAYITRCREINPIINAIVESRFEIAIQEAREADELVRSGKKSLDEISRETPLLGIPVTVKESIGVQGMSHSAGVKRSNPQIALQDADAVHRVRAAGGIVLLVSNTPELCMCWETYNNVTGTTVNPYDTRRTAGGSSGGEAALLASAASVLSLCSDIAGSARLPAMFCGVFGHKPTPGLVSTIGHRPDADDKEWTNFFSMGPMVRYAEDLPLLLKTMCQTGGKNLELDKKVSLNDMKFFYMEDDFGSGATNPINREIIEGINRVVRHLRTQHGVIVKKAELKGLKYSFEIATTILLRINADSIFMKGTDPSEWKSVFVEVMKYICLISPHTFPNIVYGILKKISDKTPESYYKKMIEKNATLKREFAELLGDNGVLIYPTFVSPAHYPYQIFPKICNVSYMMIYNSLGLPVTQCPIGFNRNGLPFGIQLIANPGCDNLTIALAQEIEKAFGGWQPPMQSKKPV